MYYGKLLKKTRIEANLTQEEMAEHLFCNRSVVSKLESDNISLSTSRALTWFDIVGRKDIIFAIFNGIESDVIYNTMFNKDYITSVNESGLFRKINEECFTVEELESYVYAKSEEMKQWKNNLIKYVTASSK
ncbi:helix-turn-helix transcriptional regulator [Cytobacillus praedii]|uniref:helix-turn-helix domain-containing protein n=1 Tax=Cytobacillus praedii TaxID=1742358 RepID=UPI002E1E12EF|nr:helix-turn-helix transcriptional regulator [Cytobacillus praedii]